MSKDSLDIGRKINSNRHVRLPLDFGTETNSVVGKRGSGKSHFGRVLAEEYCKAGIPLAIIDPLDCWWGLRSSKDGKKEGLGVAIFGGQHGDLPIAEGMAGPLAELIVREGLSAILSLRDLSKKAMKRFVADFCESVYRMKGKPEYRDPLQVMMDEADLFCPQQVHGEDTRVVGAVEDLVRRGRSSGFGVTLITQRPAVLNKNVLTQSESLTVFQLTGKHDKSAVRDWIHDNADPEDERGFLKSLALMEQGTAWVWAPRVFGLEEVRVRDTETFDSSFTPKIGQRRQQPKTLAEVDLATLEGQLSDAVEAAKADDPKVLRDKIRALERELDRAKAETPPDDVDERIQEAVASAERFAHEVYSTRLNELADTVQDKARERIQELFGLGEELRAIVLSADQTPKGHRRQASTPQPPARAPRPSTVAPDAPLPKAELAILTAVLQFGGECTKSQASILSGYSIKSSSFQNAIGGLRSKGLLERGGPTLRSTAEAGELLPSVEPLPSGDALLDVWCEKLGKAPAMLLRTLVDQRGRALDKEELAELSGYSLTSSSFQNAIGTLRSLGLATKGWPTSAAETLLIR